jgi:hypothetical protein
MNVENYLNLIINAVVLLGLVGVYLYFKPTAIGTIKKLKDFNLIRAELEEVIIDFLVGIIPFFSAVAPAYWTYHHFVDVMQVPSLFAFVVALVVEALAFSNISELTTIQQYNKDAGEARGMKTYKKQSLKPIYFNLALYLTVVIMVNSVLAFVDSINHSPGGMDRFVTLLTQGEFIEIAKGYTDAVVDVVIIFLTSLLTIPGAVTIAVRTNHRRYLQKKEEEKQERKQKPAQQEKEQEEKEQPKKEPSSRSKNIKKTFDYLKSHRNALIRGKKGATAKEIGITRPTLDNYVKLLSDKGLIKVNDAGYIVKVNEEIK